MPKDFFLFTTGIQFLFSVLLPLLKSDGVPLHHDVFLDKLQIFYQLTFILEDITKGIAVPMSKIGPKLFELQLKDGHLVSSWRLEACPIIANHF